MKTKKVIRLNLEVMTLDNLFNVIYSGKQSNYTDQAFSIFKEMFANYPESYFRRFGIITVKKDNSVTFEFFRNLFTLKKQDERENKLRLLVPNTPSFFDYLKTR